MVDIEDMLITREIDEKTKELSETYGIEHDKIRQFLNTTAQRRQSLRGSRLYFSPSLESALKYLGPKHAISLFESERIEVLSSHEWSATILASKIFPWYRLDDLSWIVSKYIAWMKLNRESLIETGLPNCTFSESSWLYDRCGSLYPCRLPCRVDGSRNSRDGFDFSFKWPLERVEPKCHFALLPYSAFPGSSNPPHLLCSALGVPQTSTRTFAFERFTSDGRRSQATSYSLASIPFGLAVRDCAWVDEIRGILYSIRVSVFEKIEQALLHRDNSGLWTHLIEMLKREFSVNDLSILLESERTINEIVRRFDRPGFRDTNDYLPDISSGGLSNLIEIVGHIELEIENETIGEGLRLLKDGGVYGVESDERGYYYLLSKFGSERVDPAVEIARLCDRNHRAYFDLCRLRLWGALKSEFEVDVTFKKRTKRINAEKLYEYGASGLNALLDRIEHPEINAMHTSEALYDDLRASHQLIRPDPTQGLPPGLYPSEDYTSVRWIRSNSSTEIYLFNKAQGAAVRELHEAWKIGGGVVSGSTIMAKIDQDFPPRNRRRKTIKTPPKTPETIITPVRGIVEIQSSGERRDKLKGLFRSNKKTHPAWMVLIKGGKVEEGKNLRGQYYLDLEKM